MMKLTTIALLGLFSSAFGAQQTFTCAANTACRVTGNQTLIVIAGKNVPSLIVDCLGNSKCKKNGANPGLIVYSSANITTINCDGENSCEESTVKLGITPPGGNSLQFTGTRKLAIINCPGKCSCKKIDIDNEGTLTNGLTVVLPTDANNGAAFNSGNILCNSAATTCTTQCGDIVDMCKDSKCLGEGTCNCVGTACPADFNIAPTPKPTSPPSVTPPLTPRPTPAPEAPRNSTSCTNGICTLTPGINYDVDCAASATKCRVECIGEAKCQDGTIILADSPEVELICEGKNACDKIRLMNTAASVITIKVTDEAGAQNMKVIIENPATTISIDIMGKDGFANGELFCNGECQLQCMGSNACKTALYECLTTQDKCSCSSMDDTCPAISYFGDSSCANVVGTCTLTPDGNTRIVAPNDVDTLVVNCLQENQCKKAAKGLRIFTAAKTTTINCLNKYACEGIVIKGGSLTGNNVPKGFEESEFTTPNLGLNGKQTLRIKCDGEDACKSAEIYTTGDIEANISGEDEDALALADMTCNGCNKLDLECLEFRGCPSSTLKCNPLTSCNCQSIHVFVNLTEVTTSEPRNSCPSVQSLRKQSIAAQTTLSKNVNNSNNIFIPIGVIAALFILCIAVVVMYNYKKQYKTIPDDKSTKLQNVLNTYQVEMN